MHGVSGIVLAGGLGRRMGGVDKGLQLLHGRPLIAHVLARLAPQVDEIVINANQNQERYAAFGHRVVPDEIGGSRIRTCAGMRPSTLRPAACSPTSL